jgi:hypothetical protein
MSCTSCCACVMHFSPLSYNIPFLVVAHCIIGTKQFCPAQQWDKTVLSPVLSRRQKSHRFFLPWSATRIDNSVAGQRLSIVAASADHSAAAAVSAGDNDDNNNEANEPSPRAATDADGGGQRQPDDRLASVCRELASYNADAHGGRTTSSNHVTNEGGGAAGNAPGRVYRQQSANLDIREDRWG